MSALLLVGNPAKRRKSRKAPSPAQRAARAKFAAMARARSKKARSNPAKRRTTAAKVRTVYRAAKRRVSRRVRRNPVSASLSMRSIVAQLKNAGMGAAGAIGVDIGYGFVQSYLPEAVQSPTDATGGVNYGYYAAKGATAIAAGLLLKRLIGSAKAAQMVEGSLTVTLHDAAKQVMSSALPSVTLGYMPGGAQVRQLPRAMSLNGMGMQVSGVPRRAALTNQNLRGVGAYVSASAREVGVR